MKNQIFTIITGGAFSLFALGAQAQQKVKDGTVTPATSLPKPGAILDLESTERGLLLPRVSLGNTTTFGLNGGAPSPAQGGYTVYNTNAGITAGSAVYPIIPGGVGEYYWDGTGWVGKKSAATEPWYNAATSVQATANTQNIYQMGNVGVHTTPAAGIALDVLGKFKLVDGTQGTNKVLTSDANGNARWDYSSINTVRGYPLSGWNGRDIPHNLGHQNAKDDKFYFCGSYIDLPPGRWNVNVNMLMAHSSGQLYTSPDNSSFWLRSSFIETLPSPFEAEVTVTAASAASYVEGSFLVSGNLPQQSVFSTVTGSIILLNNTATTKRFYYVAGDVVIRNTSLLLHRFGGFNWAEDQIVAYRIEN